MADSDFPGLTPPDWHADAACQDYPHAWWFPDAGESKTTVTAKAICGRCNVRSECLDYAMAAIETRDHGIWAGTSPSERKRLHRERNARTA